MMMKVLIIEDEPKAADKIIRHLNRIDSEISIVTTCASIKESNEFLSINTVDLIISDIHLSDGLSFEIFKKLNINTPVIFTTAYDKYAIEAFKTNSIDYLLKPVKKALLEDALKKFDRLKQTNRSSNIDFNTIMESIKISNQTYKERFLVEAPNGELKSVASNDIAYFYADGKYTFLISKNEKKYFSKENISTLVSQLDTTQFFKLNRKYLVHIDSISQIVRYSKSRLKVVLNPATDDTVVVSHENAFLFKEWLNK